MLSTSFRSSERAVSSCARILRPYIAQRTFSICPNRLSQIGRTPLTVPPEVSFVYSPPPETRRGSSSMFAPKPTVQIEGPLGKLSMSIPPFVNVQYNEKTRKVNISVKNKELKTQRAMWGTIRAYLNNLILGVSEGHTAILRLVGVGYRATIESTATTVEPEYEGQKFVSLRVGYSHPIELPLPKGVTASTPQPTRILLEGPDKEVVSQLAANIRKWRKPEPYKGKGIFVNGETIKLKAKKGK
ncbi:hypothetical protein K3495_g10004 [Podosphaera aphanis]|nr:hypothetical protein K3495_g10004 [Podosphaera aphanis]